MAPEKDTNQLPETECLEGAPFCPITSEQLSPVLVVLTGDSSGHLCPLVKATVAGRSKNTELILTDAGISRRHARFEVDREGRLCVTDLGSKNGTFVREERVMTATLKPGDVVRLGPLVALKFELQDTIQQQLYEEATRDGLTGVLNKRSFLQSFSRMYAEARRLKQSLALLMIDGDRFKSINDRHGHATGDRVLRELAERLQNPLRKGDLLARFGGEEFVVLMPGASAKEGLKLAERLRGEVAQTPFEGGLEVTVSIGVADIDDGRAQEQAFELADQALYRAKEEGRNRVVSFDAL